MPRQKESPKSSLPIARRAALPVLPASPLPPLYAVWMNELLAGPLPSEREATCDNCAMLPAAAETAADRDVYFNPQTKCCTYLPELPNFLVGRALANEPASAGRATVVARLQAGLAVTPFGFGFTRKYLLHYQQGSGVFGHSNSLRCPHYLAETGGQCGVWQQRNAICATWFCKHERGALGDQFWQALQQLLTNIEQQLALWCVLQLGVGEPALAQLLRLKSNTQLDAQDVDDQVNAEQYRACWGEWQGRETEFYVKCAELVAGLRWADVLACCGPSTQAFARLTQAAYAELQTTTLPTNLKAGSFHLADFHGDTCQTVTYSPYDPLKLSQRVLGLLGYFDGRPTAEVLQRIADEKQLRLNEPLLQRLIDFKLLVPGEPQTDAIPRAVEVR